VSWIQARLVHYLSTLSYREILAYGASAAGAAESGLEVLRGIVEDGKPWPE
jgi:hypothetical protein